MIKNENLINRFEVCMVVELPDDLLVMSHFEKLRLFTNVTVSEIVAKYRVSVWKTLTACHQSQRITGQVGFIQFPDDFFLRIYLDHFVSITARNQQIPIC